MANLDIPCTKYCNRKEHGDFIVSALTKRSVTDADLAAFLNYTCVLCGSSKDVYKRTALHMAASCGRTNVCRWLVRQKQAKIDEKDAESGYTALHRSIFCGKIDTAVALIQLGSNVHSLDANHLTPLDHAMHDNLVPVGDVRSPFVYVWGSNTNYTLGPNQARHHPEVLDTFHKRHPLAEAKEIHLEKFHTVIVARSGAAYSFGHGQGGRLGLGTEKTVLEPMELKFGNDNVATKIKTCAIARDHCLFLTETGEVWSCGLNTHHTLGVHPPPTQLLAPRRVSKLPTSLMGVACGRHHSVAWNANALYTWGLNGGQLGHDAPTIALPKAVACLASSRRRIVAVAASVGATVAATDAGDVYVLHEHRCRAIAARRGVGIRAVSVHGGRPATSDERGDALRVLVLTAHGSVLVWQEADTQLRRCAFSLRRPLVVRDVRLHADGLVLITRDREVFDGTFAPTTTVRLARVARLYGADSVTCDLEGRNFAAIHLNTATLRTLVPAIGPSTMREDFARLLTTASTVEPDVTFRVGGRAFPAHRFVVRAASEQLDRLCGDIENVEPAIFGELLAYVYTGACGALAEEELLRSMRDAAEKLGTHDLREELDRCDGTRRRYASTDAPDLHDARLRAAADGGHVDAHRCVLAARSDFFASAFSARWTRATSVVELPSTVESVRLLVDYLYADDVDIADVERALALLVLADHVRLTRLVEACELALSRLIAPKNVLRLFAVADAYGAAQLKAACMEHACLNLALLLETRQLEQLDDALLADLTAFYARWNAKMRRRVVTPFGDAVDDATIAAAARERIEKRQETTTHRRRARGHRADATREMTPPSPPPPEQTERPAATPPPRIRAICRGHDSVGDLRDEEDYVSLALHSARDFPDLSGASAPKTPKHRQPQGKMCKLSQKERKRLNSETLPKDVAAAATTPESPKSPWNMNFEAAAPASAALGSILCEEKAQRKQLSRIRSKLLIYTQMEDKALDDLKRFYNVDNVFDEIIEVARVDYGRMAAPLWIQK